jgi:hypothetical protein
LLKDEPGKALKRNNLQPRKPADPTLQQLPLDLEGRLFWGDKNERGTFSRSQ